jgi:hypothetical protein
VAHQYNPRNFLRQLTPDLLRQYFTFREIQLEVNWDAPSNKFVELVYQACQGLADEVRETVDSDFQGIHALSTEAGHNALIEESLHYRKMDLNVKLEGLEGYHQRAIWVFLNEPKIFHVASNMNWADNLSSRYWRHRIGLPKQQPDILQDNRDRFARAVGRFYWNREGRGGRDGENCGLELYLRRERFHYIFLHPQDHTRSIIEYPQPGKFKRRAVSGSIEVIFVFDPVDGALDVYADGEVKVKRELQALFGQVMLGVELGPEMASRQPFRLNGLKRRDFKFQWDPNDPIEKVEVKSLRIKFLGTNQRVTFDGVPGSAEFGVYDTLEVALNQKSLPLDQVTIDHAVLQFEFKSVNNAKPKRIDFGLSDRSWSRKEKPEHQAIRRCLELSGIAVV